MKKTIFLFSSLFLILSFKGIGQEDKYTIEDQFNELFQKSNSYQDFKVIKKSKLRVFHSNINDTLALFESTIDEALTTIEDQKNKIADITNQVDSLQLQLTETQQKVDSISFLGIQTQKSVYNSIMCGIILVLFLLAVILFFIYQKANRTTKTAKANLAETEVELENLRKTSLKREQKIRRELQDEINKNRSYE